VPYVVVVYDVEADRTRIPRKLLRQYLTHVQNSVFEGHITEGDLEEVTSAIQETVRDDESAILYRMSSENYVDRTVVGEDPAEDQRFL
jgi:CRISPR-associated protein Cas2